MQDYLNKLTHLLLAAEGDASGAASGQIQELVGAQRWAVQEFARHDLAKLMRMSVDVRRGRLQEAHERQLHPQRSEDAMRRTLVRVCAMTDSFVPYAPARVGCPRGLHHVVSSGMMCMTAAVGHMCGHMRGRQKDVLRVVSPGWTQEILGLSHEQKLRIVDLRCRFLGCMQEVLQERSALQGALARPMPARYDGSAAMSAFAETSVDVEARVQALVARQGDAFRLMMYGVREASPAANAGRCC